VSKAFSAIAIVLSRMFFWNDFNSSTNAWSSGISLFRVVSTRWFFLEFIQEFSFLLWRYLRQKLIYSVETSFPSELDFSDFGGVLFGRRLFVVFY
jgi:hypothetical protein